MNKVLPLLIISIITTGFTVAADDKCPYKNLTVSSISEALKMKNNTNVVIEGNIDKKLSDDKYTFKDNTGSIIAEIDKEAWGVINSNTKEKIKLLGEIEQENNTTIIDVDKVKPIK